MEETSWKKLETILTKASPELIESIKKDFKHEHVCIATFSKTLFEGGNSKVPLHAQKTPYDFMMELGFTDEDLSKERLCIISDCEYQDELCNLLNHMIGYHKMPIQNIAKVIPGLAIDTRIAKKGKEMIVSKIKQRGRGTD